MSIFSSLVLIGPQLAQPAVVPLSLLGPLVTSSLSLATPLTGLLILLQLLGLELSRYLRADVLFEVVAFELLSEALLHGSLYLASLSVVEASHLLGHLLSSHQLLLR